MSKEQNDISISKPQMLNLELIALAKHNDLNGKTIYKDLLIQRNLWIAVYGFFMGKKLVPLRDMKRPVWHIDTIEMICKKECAEELKNLAKNWNPSEIYELDEDEILSDTGGLRNDDEMIVGFWWD
jgi:hypothetical protein